MFFYIRFIILSLFMFFLHPAFSSPAVNLSKESSPVTGRAPKVEGAYTTPVLTSYALVGESYSVTTSFSDLDNDDVSILYNWYVGGKIVSNSNSYSPSVADSRKSLALTLIPKTDPNKTEPSVGDEFAVGSWNILYRDPKFIFPSIPGRFLKFSEASSWCVNNGARMADVSSLIDFLYGAAGLGGAYLQDTDRMCSVHGIPIKGMCGGISSNYWASSTGPLGALVDFRTSRFELDHNNSSAHVVCMR